MKKYAILILALVLVISGYAMADRGMKPVPETQGIVTETSVNLVGNFASMTDLQWRITDKPDGGLDSIPPLGDPFLTWAGIYESTYSEDTQTHGVGLMLYDKAFDVETSGQITGQWNIEATKQIAFIGIDGAYVVSSDDIMVDGAAQDDDDGTRYGGAEYLICPFASPPEWDFPAFCNRAQAGSTIDMTVANVRTTTTDRFVMPSSDHTVELVHDVRVTELVTDVPSVGMVSTYMDVLIQEGSGLEPGDDTSDDASDLLMERIEIHDSTTGDGAITLFEILMRYDSGVVR
jgi:hypothetical protein